jgi:hypothetical protein
MKSSSFFKWKILGATATIVVLPKHQKKSFKKRKTSNLQ